MGIIKDIIGVLFTQSIIGFFAWVAWQIAANSIIVLPSIPLTAGIALWVLWFMMLYLPIFFAMYAAKPPVIKPEVKVETE